MNLNGIRRQRGVAIAELPAALWLFLVCMLFPIIMLGTVSLRTSFLGLVAKEAAHAASRAKTFELTTKTDKSAKDLAQAAAENAALQFSGLIISNVDTGIIITSLDNQKTTRQTKKLDIPANTGQNLYSIEVIVSGAVEPLLQFNTEMFGKIPGLTTPIIISTAAREMFENPQGLNK